MEKEGDGGTGRTSPSPQQWNAIRDQLQTLSVKASTARESAKGEDKSK
jgi:hypothetical protein